MVVAALNNIGLIYQLVGDFESALEYCQQAIQIEEQNGELMSMADTYGSIAGIYMDLG